MSVRYEDPWLTVHVGDCRDVLATLPAESVHCVVTSPPYWGLRDYGTASWDGGDPACDHSFKPDAGATTIRKTQTYQQGHPHRDCKCGAVRIDRQLGLEATPDCGRRGKFRLRSDLTAEQREYVVRRLLGAAPRDG